MLHSFQIDEIDSNQSLRCDRTQEDITGVIAAACQTSDSDSQLLSINFRPQLVFQRKQRVFWSFNCDNKMLELWPNSIAPSWKMASPNTLVQHDLFL